MENMANYLEILQEGLKKKITVLEQMMDLNRQQEILLLEDSLDGESFDQLVHEKAILIDSLNQLDEGFEATYDRVKGELEEHKSQYASEIARFKAEITKIMDLVVEIQASEARNKAKIDQFFPVERKKIGQSRVSQKVAMNYYKNYSRVNYIDPQLMDKKK